jgi:hypothetical protein
MYSPEQIAAFRRVARLAAWRALTATQRRNGWLPKSGKCMVRMGSGRMYATFHPSAPEGASHCRVCGRTVLRGEGRWWE